MKKKTNLLNSLARMEDYRRAIRGKSFRERGKDFEERVKRDLKKKGFKIFKSHNKHYDILAKKGDKKYAIECKLTKSSFSQAEMEFSHKAKKEGLIYRTAIRQKNGRIKYSS